MRLGSTAELGARVKSCRRGDVEHGFLAEALGARLEAGASALQVAQPGHLVDRDGLPLERHLGGSDDRVSTGQRVECKHRGQLSADGAAAVGVGLNVHLDAVLLELGVEVDRRLCADLAAAIELVAVHHHAHLGAAAELSVVALEIDLGADAER